MDETGAFIQFRPIGLGNLHPLALLDSMNVYKVVARRRIPVIRKRAFNLSVVGLSRYACIHTTAGKQARLHDTSLQTYDGMKVYRPRFHTFSSA